MSFRFSFVFNMASDSPARSLDEIDLSALRVSYVSFIGDAHWCLLVLRLRRNGRCNNHYNSRNGVKCKITAERTATRRFVSERTVYLSCSVDKKLWRIAFIRSNSCFLKLITDYCRKCQWTDPVNKTTLLICVWYPDIANLFSLALYMLY